MTVRKWDVIDALRRKHSLRSMVQILTPSTGSDMHGRPELARFTSCTTLMYASEQQRHEMEEARVLPTLAQLEAWCDNHPRRTDLVFIDTWHAYDDSVRSLAIAFSMLSHGGFIVMHDCDPPNAEVSVAAPVTCATGWCGEAWRAFVDVTASLPPGHEWFVVESDYGVGVITVPRLRRLQRLFRRNRRSVERHAPDGHEAGWDWFIANREDALHLISSSDWHWLAAQ